MSLSIMFYCFIISSLSTCFYWIHTLISCPITRNTGGELPSVPWVMFSSRLGSLSMFCTYFYFSFFSVVCIVTIHFFVLYLSFSYWLALDKTSLCFDILLVTYFPQRHLWEWLVSVPFGTSFPDRSGETTPMWGTGGSIGSALQPVGVREETGCIDTTNHSSLSNSWQFWVRDISLEKH